MVDVAEIKIWGRTVGAIRWDSNRGLSDFQFDSSFLTSGYDLSPIKMPLKNGNRIYSFPELTTQKDTALDTFKGLPGLLADSLPDRYGNQLIDLWLTQNGRRPGSMNPVEQLCFIGSRGMGALEFEPAKQDKITNSFKVEIQGLVEVAHQILKQKSAFKTTLKTDKTKGLSKILSIGTSAGGARPKAVIAYNEKSQEVRSGQALAPKGFEHWLMKLDGVSDVQLGSSKGYGRVEYAYYLMAKDCGIEMMESRLYLEGERAHFMTKRFDRANADQKHHIQTWCGIQHFDYNYLNSFSYEQLFQTMRILRLSYSEAQQMYRRMVFNVLATNFDDHTKNVSFILKKEASWALAPAYDMCFSYSPNNNWVNKHTLSINGKHLNITETDLLTIAKSNNIKNAKDIIDQIKQIVLNWVFYAQKASVSEELTNHIKTHLVAFKFH